jgi:hypothetical protein
MRLLQNCASHRFLSFAHELVPLALATRLVTAEELLSGVFRKEGGELHFRGTQVRISKQ